MQRQWSGIVVVVGMLAALTGSGTAATGSVTVIAYGDTRFTDPSNSSAANPGARTALVARIADEHPDAILINGDLPWHGGSLDDYEVYRTETTAWRERHLRVIPALGNHEFAQCEVAACLEHWWATFPELRGRRWHDAVIGQVIRVLALDTMSPLTPGSEQREWLERVLATLAPETQFVIITLHHPPVADVQTRLRVDHNPRPNELALAELLDGTARTSLARFLVVAGHVHNYERFVRNDVTYLVAGGGGAVPYEVDRTPADQYQKTEFPNFHYVKLTMAGGTLAGEMVRLDDPATVPAHFTVQDTFVIQARPPWRPTATSHSPDGPLVTRP
jgi:3',5'-cyclic AMP phosphodiesterase CpdA